MANSYVATGSEQTVQVKDALSVVEVERVQISTVPSGVTLYVDVPLKQWQAGNEDTFLEPPASIVEGLIKEGMVTDAAWVQATDPSRLLAGAVDFTVSYTPPDGLSGPFSTRVRIPMTALATRAAYTAYAATPPHEKPITTAYDRLVSTAGG